MGCHFLLQGTFPGQIKIANKRIEAMWCVPWGHCFMAEGFLDSPLHGRPPLRIPVLIYQVYGGKMGTH